MPLLLAVSPHFRHRHAGDIRFAQRVLDVVHLVLTNDRLDHLHTLPSNVRCRSDVSACCSACVSLIPDLVMWNTSMAFSPSVAMSTRSTSQPWCEMTRLILSSSPSALLATISM